MFIYLLFLAVYSLHIQFIIFVSFLNNRMISKIFFDLKQFIFFIQANFPYYYHIMALRNLVAFTVNYFPLTPYI